MNKEERISKRELMEMYNVDRSTIESWVRERGLPLIQISSHKKFIRLKDLVEWEDNSVK
ncbi:MAG: hypothetical protein HOB13_06405 [Lentimicrobiaceae bacterium]|nr:hypothetical protein [Lentimicrobiaceae bacterium]